MSRQERLGTRQEVRGEIHGIREELRKKEKDLGIVKDDYEVVERTKQSLQPAGTADGGGEVIELVNRAQEVTGEVFEKEDKALETVQERSEAQGERVREQSEAVKDNLERLAEARSTVVTRETAGELDRAKRSSEDEGRFLHEVMKEEQEQRQESKRIEAELRARVHRQGV